MDVPMQ